MKNAIIEFKNVNKKFGKNVTIFNDVNCFIEHNQIIGLVGDNGSGKTTFIKMIGGLLKPDAGSIFIMGEELRNERDIIKTKNIISILGDANRALYWNLSGIDNIKYFWSLKTGTSTKHMTETVFNLINDFNMSSFINKKVESYSKGMKQRLLLVISLLNSPKLLIMDEPLNGLDFENVLMLKQLIKDYVDKHFGTVLLTSHDMNFIDEICDVKYKISNNKINLISNSEQTNRNIKIYFKINNEDFDSSKLIKYNCLDSKVSNNIKYINIKMNNSEFYSDLSEEIKENKIELLKIL